MTDRVGEQFGIYRLVRLLGRGGSADTYLAEHVYLKTFAAIKVLQTELSQGDATSFYNEARTIANLNHPNIVRVLDFGSSWNTPYIAMDYAPNGTVRQLYRRGTALPLQKIIPYVLQAAAALQYAHNQRVIHRDVKPENMLLSADNEVLLSDFGIAVVHDVNRKGKLDIAGTVTYMAPEQLRGRPCPASDQYALGIVVYEWLCGIPPFRGSQIEVAIRQERDLPPSLCERVPSLPIEVEQVVLTALAKDPEQRFVHIQAFAHALEQVAYMTDAATTVHTVRKDGEESIATEITPLYLLRTTPNSGYQDPIQATGRQATLDKSTPDSQIPVTEIRQAPNNAQRGSQGYYPRSPQPAQSRIEAQEPDVPAQPPPGRVSSSATRLKLATITLVTLLLVVGSVLTFFFAAYVPNQRQIQATATAQVYATNTAQSIASTRAVAEETAQAQATATARQTLYNQTTGGPPTYTESLQAPDNYGWDSATYSDSTNKTIGSCHYAGNAYRSQALSNYFIRCLAEATNYSNLTYQVQITVVSGHTGGLIIRSDASGNGYYFGIGIDGTYILEAIAMDSNTGIPGFSRLASGTSAAIKTGNHQPNLLTIVAQGDNIYIYVNKQYIDSARDGRYSSGRVGIYSDGDIGDSEVVVRNAQAWVRASQKSP